MLKALFTWLGLSLCTLGYLYTTNNPVLAQVTSDGTVSTQVKDDGNTAEITGGETRGNNLFHSFEDFSVKTENEAFFNNADSIANIFSRVTGGNVSDIDGVISANGSANLFLINPAGIIFGENASLNIGGSFLGSTASSILFEDGEFSATDLNNPPVLTINAPVGLNLRDQPADIVNRSVVRDNTEEIVGLEVLPGNNLAFVGGDIKFETGVATARGGNVELGGLSVAGTVGISSNWSLSFPQSIPRADISLNASDIFVAGTSGGNITINARNLDLGEGEFDGGSIFGTTLQAGITADSTSPEAQAGDITINSTESIIFKNSLLSNNVDAEAVGNSGRINLNTSKLSLTKNSSISADSFGQGDGGSIEINANESITLRNSDIFNSVGSTVEGNGGNIQIATGDFSVSNNSSVDASTSGIGNGGEVNITANNLSLAQGGEITANTFGSNLLDIAQGDGGNITIKIADTLSIDGFNDSDFQTTGIFASNRDLSTGNAGNIQIITNKLSLINGGQINSFTRGIGNAGNTIINAQDSIFLSGEDSGVPSGIFNGVEERITQGNGGTIRITTKNLSVFNAAEIDVFSFGQGDAGLIDIKTNILSLDNNSLITARAFNNDADGGNLAIDADLIVAYPNGNSDILASAEQGKGGNITINADSVLGIEQRPLNDSTNDINATSQVTGLDGTVNINTSDINPVQGATELPSNVVEAKQTSDQTCSADREGKATNGLAIAGRGGVNPAPDLPLSSEKISNENPAQVSIPQPLETSQGKIQPARGIKVTKSGKIVLTAYPTDNVGERIPEIKPNCN